MEFGYIYPILVQDLQPNIKTDVWFNNIKEDFNENYKSLKIWRIKLVVEQQKYTEEFRQYKEDVFYIFHCIQEMIEIDLLVPYVIGDSVEWMPFFVHGSNNWDSINEIQNLSEFKGYLTYMGDNINGFPHIQLTQDIMECVIVSNENMVSELLKEV